jgi:hypothetical protein
MKKLIFGLIGISLFSLSIGCNKVEPTTATITVRDESKVAISNVAVTLNATPAVDSKKSADTSLTNINLISGSDGKVTYDFSSIFESGQAGAAVIDIYAKKIVGSDTLVGISHVVLEPEKNNEAIVTLIKQVPEN